MTQAEPDEGAPEGVEPGGRSLERVPSGPLRWRYPIIIALFGAAHICHHWGHCVSAGHGRRTRHIEDATLTNRDCDDMEMTPQKNGVWEQRSSEEFDFPADLL